MKVVGVMTNLTETDLPADVHVPDFRSVRIRVDGNGGFEIEIGKGTSLQIA
jgi:hypothetical protein